MSKNFEEELKQVQEFLKNDFGWKYVDINFVHQRWITNDLETMTPRDAAEKHHLRCEQLFQSVKSEFQAKHSAMPDWAAKSYADKYN